MNPVKIGILLLFAYINVAQAASPALFLSPTSGSFFIGSTFDLSIVLDTKDQVINRLEIELFFPADKLQLTNPSIGRSLIQSWDTQPVFSNREGRVYFSGSMGNSGIRTSNGIVLTLTFRAIAPGSAYVEFGDKSLVYAKDGLPVDILGQAVPAFLTLNPAPALGPKIVSPTHPNVDKWYRDATANFTWVKEPLADGFSYTLDRDPSGFPDSINETEETSASFSDLESGIWYFHLRQKVKGVWGGVSHLPIRIDSNPPLDFDLSVLPGRRTADRNLLLRFFTTDSLSGLDHYELKTVSLSRNSADTPLFFEITSPHLVSNLEIGRYHIIVRAYDKAGNYNDQLATVNIINPAYKSIGPDGMDLAGLFIPWTIIFPIVGLLALILVLTTGLMWRKHRFILNTVKKTSHYKRK